MAKTPSVNAGDVGSILGPGRSPRGRNGNPLQDSCLENPMDRGAWPVKVQRIAKSHTTKRLSTHTYAYVHTGQGVVLGQQYSHHLGVGQNAGSGASLTPSEGKSA